ncbi:MAG TPA: GNAT family N-acetyltransferase [Candidatus Acidoferrales bacterium]|nr:GNAT family N-acetyltransferase [Candidatus Acidoferrales bacterium]
MRIESAESPEAIGVARELFVEYSESVGVGFCFQGFTGELAQLPGEYARPWGRLFLAFDDKQVAGCGALRRINAQTCEMKRFYVRSAFRGKGFGRELIHALIDSAREIGYARMRLDTLPSMAKAIAIYRSLGFEEIASYRTNPVPGALFFERRL